MADLLCFDDSKKKGILLGIIACLIFSINAEINKYVSVTLGGSQANIVGGVRYILSGCLLYMSINMGKREKSATASIDVDTTMLRNGTFFEILVVATMGVFLFRFFLDRALQYIPAGTASLLEQLEFLFATIFGLFVFKLVPNKLGWLGLVLTFLGALILFIDGGVFVSMQGAGSRGVVLAMCASLFISLKNVAIKWISCNRGVNTTSLLGGGNIFGGLFLIVANSKYIYALFSNLTLFLAFLFCISVVVNFLGCYLYGKAILLTANHIVATTKYALVFGTVVLDFILFGFLPSVLIVVSLLLMLAGNAITCVGKE